MKFALLNAYWLQLWEDSDGYLLHLSPKEHAMGMKEVNPKPEGNYLAEECSVKIFPV